jgi:hypothetical protein
MYDASSRSSRIRAAIFGRFYVLPDWLQTERPIGDPGYDYDECDVELVY